MDWKVLLILLISEYVRETKTHNKLCTVNNCDTRLIRRRHAEPSYRHRPQLSKCHTPSKCNRLHKYLLLATGSTYQDELRDCSFTMFLNQESDLQSFLSEAARADTMAILIVHTPYHQKRLYIDLMEAMIVQLGNLSLYADDRRKYHVLSDACDSREDKCENLISLTPVIEQNLLWRGNSRAVSSTALDLYDPRWLSDGEGADFSPLDLADVYRSSTDVDTQLRMLATVLCARDRRHNLFYEYIPFAVHEKAQDKEMGTHDNSTHGESRLELSDILPINPKKYDKNRPPKHENQPTRVDFHITVLSLDSINEESMTYYADIFLAQSWRDQRLRLPESMENYRILDVDWLHDIWKPDSFFKNAKHVTFHEISVPNHYLWLYHDKTLLYMSKLSLVLSCAMKFESYPHDTQVCNMMIESLSHTTEDLIFRWNLTTPLVVNDQIELPQLDIARNHTSDCTIQYSTGSFTCLSVVFVLRRRLGYHLFHTYIPSALIVVMSWISFWIKPEAIPARITLGVTSLLTLATQNTQSQQSLPPVSYVKAIDIWMSSCSIFVFLSLMEFALVNIYMGPVATKPMKGYSEADVRVEDDLKSLRGGDRSPTKNVPAGPQYPTFCNGKAIALYIDKFSRIFFPFIFIVLNIIYWTSYVILQEKIGE